MRTYYSQEVEYNGKHVQVSVRSAWESRGGGMFYNSRVQLLHKGKVISERPIWEYTKMCDRATRLMLRREPLPV